MNVKDIYLAAFTAMIWGFNFIVIKVGLDSFPPLLFSGLRFACAAFPAVLFVRRGNVPWRTILTIGIILGVVKFSFLFVGMDAGLPPGLSSLVLQSQAIFTSLLAAIILKDSPNTRQKIGIAIAFSGIGLIAWDFLGRTSLLGLILVLTAAAFWGLSNIFMKLAGNIDMFRLIIWMSIIPPIPLFILSGVFEEGQIQALTTISAPAIGAVLYTGLISTVLAYGIWGSLFKKYSPNVVAPFSLLVPISGIFFSVILLNETFSPIKIAASILVFIGVMTTVLGGKKSVKEKEIKPQEEETVSAVYVEANK